MAEERGGVLVRLPLSIIDRLRERARINDRSASAEGARIIREDLERNASAPKTSVPDITQ